MGRPADQARAPVDGCDVWQFDLTVSEAVLEGWLAHCLCPDERARADRFATRQLRDRFVAAHGALRQVLGRYSGPEALAAPYVTGEWGKPSLAGGAPAVFFNLSHSGDHALVAISGSEIGVDLEQKRAFSDMAAVARRVARPAELAAVLLTPDSVDPDLFFRLWTLKEAVCKATGEGLGADPRRVDVSVALTQTIATTCRLGEPYHGVCLAQIEAPPGYAAAVASLGSLANVRRCEARFLASADGGAPTLCRSNWD